MMKQMILTDKQKQINKSEAFNKILQIVMERIQEEQQNDNSKNK